MYDTIDVAHKTKSAIAKELATIWMDKSFYNRGKLNFDEQQQYKELLLTQWNKSHLSYDGNYSLFYSTNSTEELCINAIDGSISYTHLRFDIDETGFLYGAWDEQNNIWLYGEDIGIRMYKFDGDQNWERLDDAGENAMPYALRQVVDAKE